MVTEVVDGILKCDHSNASYSAVRFCGAVCCAVQDGSKHYPLLSAYLISKSGSFNGVL